MKIFDFLNWLNTSDAGMTYMSKYECSREDLIVITLIGVALIGVCIQYLIVAYHHWSVSKRYEHTATKRYLLSFTGVFIFCMSTYLYDFLSIWWASYKLQLFILVILNIVTGFFIKYMYKTKSVSKLNEAGIALESKTQKLLNRIELRSLTAFNDTKQKPLLATYISLMELEVMKKYEIGTNSWFMVMDKDCKIPWLFYEVAVGDNFGFHFHDYDEQLETISGDLWDMESNRTYLAGDVHFLKKGDAHCPSTKNGTIGIARLIKKEL